MAPVKIRSNRVCFTLNNYTEEECISLKNSLDSVCNHLNFCIVGKEVGQSGTPHLQGYIRLKPSFLLATRGTISKWKSLFPGLQRAHLEPAYGSDQDSEKYCSKDGNIFYKYSTPDDSKRNVFSAILQCQTLEEIADLDPQFAVKYYFQSVAIARANSLNSSKPIPPKKLKPWQAAALTKLANQNQRQILFVVDEQGNSGKSVLAQFIVGSLPKKNVFYCRGGKSAGIVHALSKVASTCQYVIFDYCRNKQPAFFAWELFDQLKDGVITSLKYYWNCIQPIKVLVLTSHDLSGHRHLLTEDRWDVIRLFNASQEPASFDPITDSTPEFRTAYNLDAPSDCASLHS
jgi:hypothetical protein